MHATFQVQYISNYDVPTITNSLPIALRALENSMQITTMIVEELEDDDVFQVGSSSRSCKFATETDGMWYFKYYSHSACVSQCIAELKIKLCNCTDKIDEEKKGTYGGIIW